MPRVLEVIQPNCRKRTHSFEASASNFWTGNTEFLVADPQFFSAYAHFSAVDTQSFARDIRFLGGGHRVFRPTTQLLGGATRFLRATLSFRPPTQRCRAPSQIPPWMPLMLFYTPHLR